MKIEIDDKEMAGALKQAVLDSIERIDVSHLIEDRLLEIIDEMIDSNRNIIIKTMLDKLSNEIYK